MGVDDTTRQEKSREQRQTPVPSAHVRESDGEDGTAPGRPVDRGANRTGARS